MWTRPASGRERVQRFGPPRRRCSSREAAAEAGAWPAGTPPRPGKTSALPLSKPTSASRAHRAALIRRNCGGPPVMPPPVPATASNSLSTGPGHTWVTTTVPAKSARNASLKPSTKCLLAEYAAAAGITDSPAPDPMMSTPPRPRSTIEGTKAAVSCATATTLVCRTCRMRLQSAR